HRLKPDGRFEEAVFETTEKGLRYQRGRSWNWTSNPFTGSHELNGLKIGTMLVSNWDNKDIREIHTSGSNLSLMEDVRGGQPRLLYYVNDWGQSMGAWGSCCATRRRWQCWPFMSQTHKFVRQVEGRRVEFGYAGQ